MILNFPTPYPDELLYSVFARYAVRAGNVGSYRTSKELFGNERRAVLEFTNGLGTVERRLGGDSFTSEELLSHTLFYFYAPFLPMKRVREIKDKMINGDGQGISTQVGLNAFSIKNGRTLKHCRECAKEDIDRYGETYWHITHQLPGVWVCPHHQTILVVMDKYLKNPNPIHYMAASRDIVDAMTEIPVDQEIRPYLEEYAKNARWLMNEGIEQFPPNYFYEQCASKLKNMDILSQKNRLDKKKWVGLWKQRYPDKFLEFMDCFIPETGWNWLSEFMKKKAI